MRVNVVGGDLENQEGHNVTVLAGAVGLMVGAGLVPALAADLSTPLYKAPPAAPPLFSWTGCYVGVEGGGAWGQSQHVAAAAPKPASVGLPITLKFNLAGALAGGTVGCNYQVGNVVLGVDQQRRQFARYAAF